MVYKYLILIETTGLNSEPLGSCISALSFTSILTVTPTPTLHIFLRWLDLKKIEKPPFQDAHRIYTVGAIGHINRFELLSGFFHIRDPPRAPSAIARWTMVDDSLLS
jgi:hypothetical protein